MNELNDYITSLWANPKHPAKQVELIAELSGQNVAAVIMVLKAAKKIPRGVTALNYKERLPALPPKISAEMRSYIIGSMKMPQTLARELRIPMEEILRIRKKAREEAVANGRGAVKKSQKRRARHAKDASGDGNRAGAGDRRGRKRATAGCDGG